MVLSGADHVDMKIVLLGQMYSGKTCLVERYLNNHFAGMYSVNSTIGSSYGARTVDVDGRPIIIGIWDTAGSERYEAMSRFYYREAGAAIICYDITEQASYDRALRWSEEIQENEQDCRIYFCGTKKDLVDNDKSKRVIDYHNVLEFAEKIHARVIETSSKTGENIHELFQIIVEDFAKDPKNSTKPAAIQLNLEAATKTNRSHCCYS